MALYVIGILFDSGFEMQCAVLETSHLIGKKWSIPLLIEIKMGKFKGFYKFTTSSSITPKTLSNELKELTRAGLIEKSDNAYSLTGKGLGLCNAIDEIKKWNIKWNNTPKSCLERSCMECTYFANNGNCSPK